MAIVAICPNCDFEFMPPGDASAGDFADCPACGASVALRTELDDVGDAAASTKTIEMEPDSVEFDPAERRIEKWFRSAETVVDLPEGEATSDILDRPLEDPPQDEQAPVAEEIAPPGPPPIDDDISTAVTIDEAELTPPEELPQRGATWDDSEHMDRLLADIDAQPANEDLPETDDSPAHDVETATISYSPEEQAAISASTERRAGELSRERTNDLREELAIAPSKRPRRRSVVRMLVGSLLAAVVGLGLGYVALLWLAGPSGDLLHVAHVLPSAILPPSLRAERPSGEVAQPAPFVASVDSAAGIGDGGDGPSETLPEPVAPAVALSDANTPAVPAERQASFEAPSAGAAGAPAMPGDRNANTAPGAGEFGVTMNEPVRFDVNSMGVPTPVVRGAPSYSQEQLAAALAGARDALPGLIDGSLDDKTVQRTKGLSYSKLAELAEAATFFGDAQSAGGTPLADEVDAVFTRALADPRVREEVARIVPIWISSAHRRHGGIFFAGGIGERVNHSGVGEIQMYTSAGAGPVVVLAPAQVAQRLDATTRSVAVVGSLIDRPGEKVDGYTGTAPQAVWAHRLIPLE